MYKYQKYNNESVLTTPKGCCRLACYFRIAAVTIAQPLSGREKPGTTVLRIRRSCHLFAELTLSKFFGVSRNLTRLCTGTSSR